MKKYFILISLSISLLLLAACGGSSTSTPSSDGLKDLINAVDANGNLDSTITITVKSTSLAKNLSTAAVGKVEPVILEIDASTPKGKPFKAILVGSSENALAAGFTGEMRLRGKKSQVNGESILVGYAAVLDKSSPKLESAQFDPSVTKFSGFAFLAVKEGVTLAGPEVGAVYNMDGKAALKGFCTNEHLVGASLFKNRLDTVRVVNATLALLNERLPCTDGQQVSADVMMNFESQVVDTHLGKVLSSYGVIEVMRGEDAYTMPVFTIGVPELLSERIKQERFEAKTADNVFTLTPFFMSEIESIAKGVISLRELPEGFEALKAGDLLVSRPFARIPNGLLREVTKVETSAQGVRIATRAAKLEQVIQEGGFSFSRPLTAEDLTADITGYDGVDFSAFNDIETLRNKALASQGLSAQALSSQALDLLPRVTINKTLVSGLKLEGYVDLGVQPVFEFSCRKAFCAELKVVGKFVVTEEAELALIGEYDLGYNKTIPLGPPIPLGTFVIYAGIPITVTPSISFDATITATGEVDINVTATQSLTLEVGVEKPYGEGFKAVKSLEKELGFDVDYSGSFEASARAAVRGSITVLGTLSAYADFGPFIEFEAQFPGDPLWDLRGGINSFAGLEYDILFASDNVEFEIFERSWSIASAENTAPDIVDFVYEGAFYEADGLVKIPPNSPITFRASVYDEQEGSDCCDILWSLNSSVDGFVTSSTTTGRNQSFNYTPTKEAIYTLTQKAVDAKGLSKLEQFEFTAKPNSFFDTPPTFVFFDRNPGANIQQNEDVTFRATIEHPTDPDCCDINWFVDGVSFETTSGRIHSFTTQFTPRQLGQHTVEARLKPGQFNLSGIPPKRISTFTVDSGAVNQPPVLNELSVWRPEVGPFEVGEEITFYASFDDDSHDGLGEDCCTLEFRDNSRLLATYTPPFTVPLFNQTYTTAGFKTLEVTAIDDDGAKTVASITINIQGSGGFTGSPR